MLEVGERGGLLLVVGDGERLESLHSDHPGRDGGPEILGPKGSQWDILPLLDVPGAPVVHQDHPEDVFVSVLHLDGLPQGVGAAAEEESHLQLKVHQPTGTKLGRFVILGLGLTTRPAYWSPDNTLHHITLYCIALYCITDLPGHHHTGGSAVVTNRKMFPVGHQGVLLPPEHGAHVSGVVQGGVEVRVVPDISWEVHGEAGLGQEGGPPQLRVVPQLGAGGGEEAGDGGPGLRPVEVGETHQPVEVVAPEDLLLLTHQRSGEQVRHFGEVEDLLPHGHPQPGAGLPRRAEDAVGEVLKAEVRLWTDLDPGAHDERLGWTEL